MNDILDHQVEMEPFSRREMILFRVLYTFKMEVFFLMTEMIHKDLNGIINMHFFVKRFVTSINVRNVLYESLFSRIIILHLHNFAQETLPLLLHGREEKGKKRGSSIIVPRCRYTRHSPRFTHEP